MKKYGAYCNKCGDYLHSDTKTPVQEFRKEHECAVTKTKAGTFARPALVDQINANFVTI